MHADTPGQILRGRLVEEVHCEAAVFVDVGAVVCVVRVAEAVDA